MTIHGIDPAAARPDFAGNLIRPGGNHPAPPIVPTTRGTGVATPQPAARTGDALPPEPPAGTDPALWGVLTADERAYFARARALGPLTYGRGASRDVAPGVRLGGRIDLRV